MEEPRTTDLSEIQDSGLKLRWWIVVGGNGLALVIGLWIIGNVSARLAIAESELVRAVQLVLYLASWILGANYDVIVQRLVFTTGKVPLSSYRRPFIVVLILIIAGGILIWAIKSDIGFAAALSAFFLINVFSWMFYVRTIGPIIHASEETYRNLRRERLPLFNIVTRYLTGRWQWWRFAAMLTTICFIDVISFWPTAREFIAGQIHYSFPNWPVETVANLLPATFVALFMIVAEAWIWFMRIRMDFVKRRIPMIFQLSEVTTAQPQQVIKVWQGNRSLKAHMTQSFELQLTWPRYLWAAHGAGLLASITFFSAHVGSAQVYGIGIIIIVFASGLSLAALGYSALTIARDSVLDAFVFGASIRVESKKAAYKAWLDLGISFCLLLLSMAAVAFRFGSL